MLRDNVPATDVLGAPPSLHDLIQLQITRRLAWYQRGKCGLGNGNRMLPCMLQGLWCRASGIDKMLSSVQFMLLLLM
jgi:hypothetical protein